jgi:hypothetical protein
MGANAMKIEEHFSAKMWHIKGEQALLQSVPRGIQPESA